MDTLKIDTGKTGKVLTLGAGIFAIVTDIVIATVTGELGGVFGTLILLFLIYIDVEWARWLFVFRAGFGVYSGIGFVLSTGNYLWLLAVGAYLLIAWMFGKNKAVDAYLNHHQKT